VQGRVLDVELRPGSISLTAGADPFSGTFDGDGAVSGPAASGPAAEAGGTPLEVSVRGQRVVVGPETVTLPLETVPAPAPSVFPSLFPTAGLPVIGTL